MLRGLSLTAELVPQTSWYTNMRSAISPFDWDIIRKRVYAEFGHRCGICRSRGRLHCHEVWEYDDAKHVQALRGFIALCVWCHHVKHLGYAGVLAARGELDYEEVVAHFLRVNGCDQATFEEHYNQAMNQWRERSKHPWRVDLGEYEGMVTRTDRESGLRSTGGRGNVQPP